MAKQTFTTGQVLTAAQMTSLQQTAMGGGSTTAKVASYSLVAGDAGTVVQMNSATATTITVNTGLFAAGDTVTIQNVGAGVCTITAGTATVSTSATLALKQYDAGSLYFNSTSAAIFFAVDAADGMTNPFTTTGDTVYASGGTTPTRLGIGSTGQILTVASGIPAWATPSASSFVGCSLTYLTSSQAIPNTTYTRVLFNSEDYDTDSFHDNTTNTGRITIPSGKAGKYLFSGYHSWGNYGSTGRVIAVLYVNGVAQRTFGNVTPSGYMTVQLSTTLNLSVADYVELFVYQSSGATGYIQSDNELRFQANYLGA